MVSSQSLDTGFSASQAEAFVNGRAFLRPLAEVMREMIEVHRALRAERVSTDFALLRKRVAADLDALGVAPHFGAALVR